MKLIDLKDVMYSTRDRILHCIIYDSKTFKDMESGCSAEYAMKHYGDKEVKRITVEDDFLVVGLEI